MKKAIYALLIISALTLTLTSSAARRQNNAPDKSIRRHERSIPDSYIVVLKPEVEAARVAALAKSLAAAHGGRVAAVYQSALRGFSVQLTAKAAEALAHNPAVDYVEEDGIVELTSVTQTSAPWGLDRIDQTSLPLSTTYTYTATGAGVHAYIIDSGIRTTHQEFGTRASVSFDNVGDGQNGQDCYGHGTQLAGIVGGSTYGVAKGVSLHAVRTFSCSNGTSLTKVIGGIDWVTANHQSPAVALISFSLIGTAPNNSSLDTAVNSLVTSGVTAVVAAGNNNIDVSTRTPARVAAAITVGSVDQFDTRGVLSNFGAGLDLFAPGVDLTSADWFSDTAVSTNDTGTSYAAAHAAGVAAMYLETHPFFSTPAQVSQALVDRATTGVVINPGAGSPNRLLHLTEQSQAGTAVTATKTDSYSGSPNPASPGATITYSVTISNTDTFDATHVVFTDNVDPNTTIVPGSSSAPNSTVSGDTLTVNVGAIPAGQSVSFTFQVTVDNPYAGGPNVSNQGTVTADGSVNVLTDDPDFTGTTNPTLTPIGAQIRVNDARAAEPTSGTSQMIFVVTLTSPAPGGGLTVNYTTADYDGFPATAGASCDGVSDYISASGTLTITAGSRTATIPVTICSDFTAETDEMFVLNISSPSSGTIADAQGLGTITTANPPGTLSISELRSRGPAGAGDDFVELYNNTSSPMTVAASDSSGGFGVYKMGSDCNSTPVLVATIPNGTVFPARGHYLLRGSAYSLSNYGGTNAAAGDLTMTSDVEDDRNLAVFSTANVVNISSVNRLDAVGFGTNTGGVCDLMREGSTLAPVGALNIEYSYQRKECDYAGGCQAGGYPKDTNNNSVDFMFADTAMTSISGIPQKLGAPGPQNLASPLRRDDSGVGLPLLDGTVSSAAVPNRERDFTPNGSTAPNGTLYVRRRVQNSTGSTLTKLRFRVVELTTGPTTPTGVADLRLVTSPAITISNINDAGTCASTGTPTTTPCTVTVQSTVLETPPTQSQGGGYNSTVSVAIPGGLASGASVDVNFALGVVQGGSFRFLVIIEALP